jgi:C-terminal processing protease CtpA/Prc
MARIILLTLAIALFLPLPGQAANSASNFGGVGIDGVPLADGRIVVRQLVTGGPAHLAGLRPGDIITHIDSKPTKGSNFDDMIEHRLRGQAGTEVLLSVLRAGEGKPLRFNLTRRQLLIDRRK